MQTEKDAPKVRWRLLVGVAWSIMLLLDVAILRPYLQQQMTSDWPHTDGQVTRCDTYLTDGAKPRPRVHLAYDYTLSGTLHHGQQAAFLNTSDPPMYELNRYPAGSRVQVYYDPKNPASAVLESGLDRVHPQPILAVVALLNLATFGFTLFCKRTFGQKEGSSSAARATAPSSATRTR